MHLVGAQHAHEREQRADFHVRQRFFLALARGALLQGLAVLHETRRDGPVAEARLDGALADEDPALVLGHAAHDDAGFW